MLAEIPQIRGLRESAFIDKIKYQQTLIHRRVIRRIKSFVRPVRKMALYKYFKKAPNALPNHRAEQ